jgi:hypothetical protein
MIGDFLLFPLPAILVFAGAALMATICAVAQNLWPKPLLASRLPG